MISHFFTAPPARVGLADGIGPQGPIPSISAPVSISFARRA